MNYYIALGDSISIDDYPERETGIPGIGAASLFARSHPELEFIDLTADGATTADVLHSQLPRVKPRHDAGIVTLTAGGNDMLMNLRGGREPRAMYGNLEQILDETARKLPHAIILLGTVYDPSDGTNVLYGERLDTEAQWLARFNDFVRKLAAERDNVRLADIHARFLGHGLTAPPGERWYWAELIFEPNAKGAAEVAELWAGLLPPT
jgi:lysophospholipase L1-like esterase